MKKSNRAMITLVILALSLSACLPATASNQQSQQVQNTQSSQDVQSDIGTAVAQIVEAQN